jgi:hypothetical protein
MTEEQRTFRELVESMYVRDTGRKDFTPEDLEGWLKENGLFPSGDTSRAALTDALRRVAERLQARGV